MNKFLRKDPPMNQMNTYTSLEQRVIASIKEVLPPFYPSNEMSCTKEEQENYYAFFQSIANLLFLHPELLYPKLNPDYAFPSPFTFVGGEKSIEEIMRKDLRVLQSFFDTLREIGKTSILDNEIFVLNQKINKRILTILNQQGIVLQEDKLIHTGEPYFACWKEFAESGVNRRRFETCAFDEKHDYLAMVLLPKIEKEEGAVQKILDWLKTNEYKMVLGCNKYPKDESYLVSYVKSISSKEEYVGFPYMGDATHIGFSMEYRYCAKHPYFCTIRIQNAKDILQHFETYSEDLQQFLMSHWKACDQCHYCVQMDKTHTKPLAAIHLEKGNSSKECCPYYPGFSFSFSTIDRHEASCIIQLLDEMEKQLIKK
jgi:hypothetical protein